MATIEYRKGNILDCDADLLVNPVNMMGVMGAGLAKQFAKRFPTLEERYREQIRTGDLRLGIPSRCDRVLNFATKDDWRQPSRMRWIEDGLIAISMSTTNEDGWSGYLGEFESIAFPPIGCGLGGLHWPDVRDLIEYHMGNTDLAVYIYGEPGE